MKTIADKQIVVGADRAGYPLKEAVVAYLKGEGFEVTDVGVTDPDDPNPEMFHRIGFKVGSLISEGEFEKGLIFCGTGMGIHIAANKCPHVHAAVVESIPAAIRCSTGNGCNVMSMGAFYVAPNTGIECVKGFLGHKLGDGFESNIGFKEYHELARREIDEFDYEAFKENDFEPVRLYDIIRYRRPAKK